MENIYKQYATIASSWVPNNPILAFLPFIKKYIIENKIREIRTETLMKNLKATYDLDFSLQLVISSMTYLQKNKQVEKKNGCWVIKFENEKIELSNTSIESKTNLLLAEFKKYCSENKINEINCEASLNNFFESYDHEIMVDGFENVKNDKLEKENKVVAHFLVYLQKNNEALFNFAVEIAKGSLVKSALFLDNRTFNFLNSKKFYFDTKIVLRVLGYNDQFLCQEYRKLVKQIKDKGAHLVVTSFVVNEIKSLLRGCLDYVDSDLYDYTKANSLLTFFRNNNKSRLDIQDIIARIESIIISAGFEIENVDVGDLFTDLQYFEYEEFLRNEISKEYNLEHPDDPETIDKMESIDNDIKSILYTYKTRNNNKASSFTEIKAFFITNNNALIKASNLLNQEKFKNNINSIISDFYLGVVIFDTTENLSEFSKLKLMGYCSQCHILNYDVKIKYIKKVNELKTLGKLTEEEFFLLKNSEFIDDVLFDAEVIKNNVDIYDIRKKLKNKYTEDVENKYKKDLDNKQKEIEHIQNQSQIDKQIMADQHNLKIDKQKEKKVKEETRKIKNRFKIIYIIIAGILIVASIILFIIQAINILVIENKFLKIISMVALIIFTLFQIYCLGYQLINDFSKSKILKKLVAKKTEKIALEFKDLYD